MYNAASIKPTLSKIEYFCRKTDTKTLKRLAFVLGSKEGTTKSAIRTNIITQCTTLEALISRRNRGKDLVITAVDMGIDNFAYSKLSWPVGEKCPKLLEWGKLQLNGKFLELDSDKIPFTPTFMSELGCKLTDFLTQSPPDAFVIERQRTRTMGSANVYEHILRVNTLEHILFSNLSSKLHFNQLQNPLGKTQYLVRSSDPKRMTDYWCKLIPATQNIAPKSDQRTSNAKVKSSPSNFTKMLKISLVHSLITDELGDQAFHKITFPDEFTEKFKSQSKNQKLNLFKALGLGDGAGKNKEDDLADSLLHGLAWMDWIRNYNEIANLIGNPVPDQEALDTFNQFATRKKRELESFSKVCIPE